MALVLDVSRFTLSVSVKDLFEAMTTHDPCEEKIRGFFIQGASAFLKDQRRARTPASPRWNGATAGEAPTQFLLDSGRGARIRAVAARFVQ